MGREAIHLLRHHATTGVLALLALCCAAGSVAAAEPRSPEEYLGRPVGTDFELADWEQVAGYFDELGEASPRLEVIRAGKTTEGRDFRIAVISSEENLGRIDELKGHARRIADPRGITAEERERVLERARVFLFISCNMHSTEIGSPEMSMELAYRLATSEEAPWVDARRELVVILAPTLNPDGMDRVVRWYREIQGTPYESASLPELYQQYAGHDNNRDWFALSLKETQIVTRLLYTEWFPQVYWDVHQQGSRRERFFIPPFRDPLNPNLDAAVIAGIGALGSRVLLDLTREGLAGVSTGVTYDMWWNGGNRNVPVRHNIIGLLSEAASANLASPIYIAPRELGAPRGIETGYRPSNRFPEPWPGGWWRIGDIISYELATARSLLGSLARERRHWLEGALETAERAIAEAGGDAAPQGWLIPPDNRDRGALRRLLGILLAEGIDIEAAAEAFDADEMRYPAGTLILRRDQPYGGFLKDLFEVQRYPDGPSPYDVAGWTLPLLLGVRRVEVVRPFAVRGEEVRSAEEALARLPAPARPAHPWTRLDGDDSDSLRGVIGLLEAAIPVVFDGREDSPGPGAWAIPDDPDDPRRLDRARAIIGDGDRGRILEGTEPLRDPAARVDEGGGAEAAEEQGEEVEEEEEEKEGENATAGARELVRLDRLPRVGLYAPWVASMDEGWTRWVLEAFGLPYRRLRNESIRAGNLRSIVDVLIVPSVPASIVKAGRSEGSIFPRFAGGLDPEGSVAIEEFVRAGGTLIAFDRACDFVIELFALTLENAAAGGRDEKSFRCPGSILRTVPVEGTALTAGLPPSQPVFFSGSRAFRPKEAKGKEAKSKRSAERARALKLEPLLRFPESRILLSGWIRKPEAIAGTTAWGRVKIGKGFVHLFGFRPQYRSWSQVSFRLLFRAILMPDS